MSQIDKKSSNKFGTLCFLFCHLSETEKEMVENTFRICLKVAVRTLILIGKIAVIDMPEFAEK